MKIRLLIDARMLGGIETHVMNLSEELSLHHHDCKIIFVNNYPNNILYEVCNKRSIPYHACQSIRELYSLFFNDKPDIIHAHGYNANIIARLIGLIQNIPIVTTFHSGEKPKGRIILYDFLDRWSSFMSNNICVNSIIASRIPFKTAVLPNFVTVPKTPNLLKNEGPYHIYFIGRVSPEKGPLRFCELSKESSKELHWHMVGNGPLLNECQKKYADTVYFHGSVSDMDAIWPNVDLLCITSIYEGLPLVLLEAMSRGIPVVSFDVGSIKEVHTHVECVIDSYDLLMMKECIASYFLKTLTERTDIANSSRARILSSFSKEMVVSKIEAYYDECIK